MSKDYRQQMYGNYKNLRKQKKPLLVIRMTWFYVSKRKFGLQEMSNSPQRPVWCAPSMVTPFLVHKEYLDWRLRCILPYHQQWYWPIWHQQHQWVHPRKLCYYACNKKGKLQVRVYQVDGTEWIHVLWPMKFCPKALANLFSLTCKLLQRNRIPSDHGNDIVVNNIILDYQIKTCNGWVTGVKFLCKSNDERAVSATALPKKNVNNLHVELSHPFQTITHATTKDLGIQVTGTLKPCEDCLLGKAKQQMVSKKAVPHSRYFGEWLFFDISSPSTPTFSGKWHFLLVIDDCSDYI